MSTAFSQVLYGPDNRLADGAVLDLSNPKAKVIFPWGTPITGITGISGVLTVGPSVGGVVPLSFDVQPALTFLAAPTNASGVPTFRRITASDLAGLAVGGGAGTVTSILSGTGLTGGPITTTGTLSVAGNLATLYSLANATGWLHNDGAGVLAWSTPSGSSGANPTASVGLSVVNGVAATFMRSDAAPPLDVTISPTWSGTHTFAAGKLIGPDLTSPNATDLSLKAGAGNQNVIFTPTGTGVISGLADEVLTDNASYRTWRGLSTTTGRGLYVQHAAGTAAFTGLGVAQSVYYDGQLASGSFGALTAVVSGRVVQMHLRGYDGTGWAAAGYMQFNALETWTVAHHGTEINFGATTTGERTSNYSWSGGFLVIGYQQNAVGIAYDHAGYSSVVILIASSSVVMPSLTLMNASSLSERMERFFTA